MAVTLKQMLSDRNVSITTLATAIGLSYPTVHKAVSTNIPPKRTAKRFIESVQGYLKTIGIEEEMAWSTVAPADQAPAPQLNQQPEDMALENQMLTQEAMKHFKLFRNPFINDIRDSRDVYLNEDTRYVLAAMKDVARNQGILAVVGDSGAGKSVLRRTLLDELHKDGDVTIIQPKIIDKSRATAAGICDAIIDDISSETPKRSMEAKARQVERLLMGAFKGGQRHVLIIEEAHDLTVPVMKYLKRFWELEDGFSKLLGILLIGQTELSDRLDERRHYELREFIRRCMVVVMSPMDHDLDKYLAHKFGCYGADIAKIMTPEAITEMSQRLRTRRSTSGSMVYPQVINNLTTRAMNLAASLGEDVVSVDIIREL